MDQKGCHIQKWLFSLCLFAILLQIGYCFRSKNIFVGKHEVKKVNIDPLGACFADIIGFNAMAVPIEGSWDIRNLTPMQKLIETEGKGIQGPPFGRIPAGQVIAGACI